MEIACFNRFELGLTPGDVDLCAHSGACDADVFLVSQRDYVVEQFNRIDKDAIRAELKEYGAWDTEELSNESDNLLCLVWLAAWDIREERVSSGE